MLHLSHIIGCNIHEHGVSSPPVSPSKEKPGSTSCVTQQYAKGNVHIRKVAFPRSCILAETDKVDKRQQRNCKCWPDLSQYVHTHSTNTSSHFFAYFFY
jgi:hypothetical protein